MASNCQQDKSEILGVAFKVLQDLVLAYLSYFNFLSTSFHAHTRLRTKNKQKSWGHTKFFSVSIMSYAVCCHWSHFTSDGWYKNDLYVFKLEVMDEGQISSFQFTVISQVLVIVFGTKWMFDKYLNS